MAKEFKEKTITINLRKVFEKPVTKRAISAKNMIIKAVKKETRAKTIKISNKINEELWKRGKGNILRKITVKIVAEKGIMRALMPNEKYEPKQEKKKDDKKTEEKKETKKAEQKEETKPQKALEKQETKKT